MPDANATATKNQPIFKDRGRDATRLETFVDAAFAFALTLLVISFDSVPTSYEELTIALRSIPAFLFGFAVLMMFWVAHRNWSRHYGMDTTFSVLVSMALIFIIMIYVYPLRAMATAAISAMTNGWLPTSFQITSEEQALGLFRIYGVGFMACNACLVLLFLHALNHATTLSLSDEEIFMTRFEVMTWSIVGLFGLLSVILTFVVSGPWIAACGWVYAGLGIVMPAVGFMFGTRFDRQFRQ
ncbi:MAG: TMEM175 family protein [Pseudomonadota bacterium]